MTPTLRNLESRYYRVLKTVAKKRGVPIGRVKREKIPQMLEKATVPSLHLSNTWFVSGISGSGKSTVVKMLERGGFVRLPNVVTRPKRPEESAHDYIFTDDATFLKWKRGGLLFHPHKTNEVWHAILKKNLKRMTGGKHGMYADKSVTSAIKIVQEFPRMRGSNFIYMLAPTFRTLHKRLRSREQREKTRDGALTDIQIRTRFEEEIAEMEKSVKIPYVYILNDAPERIEYCLKRYLKK